jgi:hypothetical protein
MVQGSAVQGQYGTPFALPQVPVIGHAHLGIPERTKSRKVIKVFKEYRNTP